jgi:hypothetical protein
MPLKVIGAGMPRTGTLSLKIALEKLGYGPCHHMTEVYRRPRLPTLWSRAFDGTLADFEEIFGDYNATTDAPAAFLFDALAERYPEAKVVLSIRDANSWYASMEATILTQRSQDAVAGTPLIAMLQRMFAYLAKRGGPSQPIVPGAPPPPREAMIAWFNAHNARVRSMITAERLLEFEATQGWEPLCRFLGVGVPNESYPRVNDSQEFHEIAKPQSS